jgi:ArsR family metal-binding transcriptional regulator
MTSVDIGIIADELEEVYPELISRQKIDGWEHCIGEGEEDLKTIPTESKITLTLIKAVQEQQQIIDQLKSRIETLEQQ